MCHIFICLIGNTFLFISFLGNIINTLCVLSLTLILLKDALRLPINKPSPNQTAQRACEQADKKKRQRFCCRSFVGAFIFYNLYISSYKFFFFYFFTKNILSAESGADSPRSGCEAATRCTKMYTVSLLQTIKVCFLIEREKASQAR